MKTVERGPATERHDPRPQTVLVTGGAGYIGAVLVGRLLARGYRVRVLDRFLYGDAPLRGWYDHPRLEVQVGDFRRADVLSTALRGIAAVVHLGAIVGDQACALDPAATIATNLTATDDLARACRQARVARLLFASTCSVYGASDELLDEESPLHALSLYAETKIAAERALLSQRSARFAPTILRFATAYGAAPRPRFDLVVNLLAAQALIDRRITIYGGAQWRPFVHVDDIARAIVCALEAPEGLISGQCFNVGVDRENFRLQELGALIGELVPGTHVVVAGDITDARNYRVSFRKIRERLHFRPIHSVRRCFPALRALVEDELQGNFRLPQYNNVRWLLELGTIWHQQDGVGPGVVPTHADQVPPARLAIEADAGPDVLATVAV